MRLITHHHNHEVRMYCKNPDCPNKGSWYDARVHDKCPYCTTATKST